MLTVPTITPRHLKAQARSLMERLAKALSPRHCLNCGAPEQIDDSMGVRVTNLLPYCRLCTNCINAELHRVDAAFTRRLAEDDQGEHLSGDHFE